MPEETDFDWSNKDSVVIETVDAVAVYPNPEGNIVIRQHDSMGLRDADAFVVIPRSRVKDVIAGLKGALKQK